ncbi:MAG: CDP-diacylglycerol--glycerol-3-phosphate 3-phosphatidyltransferase [Nitrospiraceae bacterium]|nr:MAG: CDP-diacylglycerol--glycerol-3-phosphate 3-phosphatidyltransferase [Nitrospiraceae bacterium]
MVNIPTIITFSRILIIIPFVLVAPENPVLGAVLFAVASLTDFLDGYLARRSRQVTKLGILLDPIADKLLVISALIVFVDMTVIPAWIAIVIIAREFIITGLRVVALSKDIVIPAEMGGKIKVTAQISSILVLLLDRTLIAVDLYSAGITLLWIAMVLGVVSGVQYFIIFYKRL